MVTLNSYYPEMGEKKPEGTQIEAQLGHYGKHYYLWTPLTLTGRGVELLGTETQADHRRAGWNNYKVTLNAMEKISKQHKTSSVSLL